MPPPPDDRLALALDAALEILAERGMAEVIPARVAERSGVPPYWFTRRGLFGARELQLALLDRELRQIVDVLAHDPGIDSAAWTLAANLPILMLADYHGLLWEHGPIPDALRVAIHPAPWWIAAAWTGVCAEGHRRGIAAPDLWCLMVDLERRHRE